MSGNDFSNLLDDDVKLVAYTMVSVRRGAERVMPGSQGQGTLVVTDRMTGEQLSAWIIARYLQSLTAEERDAVRRDQRYLRVHWVVSKRWPREPLEFERDQLSILSGVRDALGE
jgi:hypothetical protein